MYIVNWDVRNSSKKLIYTYISKVLSNSLQIVLLTFNILIPYLCSKIHPSPLKNSNLCIGTLLNGLLWCKTTDLKLFNLLIVI